MVGVSLRRGSGRPRRAAHDAPSPGGPQTRRAGQSPRIILSRAGGSGAREATMALDTARERIRPVTGTHVVRVQHEGIPTADAERAKDFYCRIFGFQVLPRPAFKSGGYWLGTPGIFPQIHIIQSEMQPPGPGAP